MKEKRIAWKIYLAFIMIIIFLSYLEIFQSSTNLFSYLDVPLSLVSLIGLYLYSFKKKVKYYRFWRLWVIFYVIWDFVYNLFLDGVLHASTKVPAMISFILSLILFIPEYIALYLLSKQNDS